MEKRRPHARVCALDVIDAAPWRLQLCRSALAAQRAPSCRALGTARRIGVRDAACRVARAQPGASQQEEPFFGPQKTTTATDSHGSLVGRACHTPHPTLTPKQCPPQIHPSPPAPPHPTSSGSLSRARDLTPALQTPAGAWAAGTAPASRSRLRRGPARRTSRTSRHPAPPRRWLGWGRCGVQQGAGSGWGH